MKCQATIVFGDDYGDNSSTFHCRLEQGHDGNHVEQGNMGCAKYKMPYTLTWEGSDDELEKSYDIEDEEME